MIESAEAEIDVEVLKARIREAVTLREASGQTSFIAASRELYKHLSANGSAQQLSLADLLVADISARAEAPPQLTLQPPFHPRADNHYQLDELLQYHDRQFVWNAYRALLKREPDEEGYQGYLAQLRRGRRNKIDILASLRYSPEGERASVEVEGLKTRAWFRRLYFVPVVGYLAELVVSLVRLPVLLRHQRQLENHLIAQQETIAHHFSKQLGDQSQWLDDQRDFYLGKMSQVAARVAESVVGLKKEQRELAELQQQQISALFRHQQRTIVDNKLRRTNGRKRISNQRWHEIYAAFADQFRGDPQTVKDALSPYVKLLKESGVTSEILDLGCGRGEWLELLKENGIRATGVENNSVFATAVRNKELDVVEAEALEYIRGLEKESLRVVTAFHLIEHLEFAQLLELLDEVKRILGVGGLLILETPNPKNLVVGACNFYSDPTHRQPIFPETLQFLLDQVGFSRVRVEYLHPAAGSPFLNDQHGSKELDTWLFGARDFAAFGWKD